MTVGKLRKERKNIGKKKLVTLKKNVGYVLSLKSSRIGD